MGSVVFLLVALIGNELEQTTFPVMQRYNEAPTSSICSKILKYPFKKNVNLEVRCGTRLGKIIKCLSFKFAIYLTS